MASPMAIKEATKEQGRISRGLLPGARAVSSLLKRLGGPAMRRFGALESGLIAEWPAIVGEFVAERSAPVKLTWPRGKDAQAVLEITVESAIAPELQHLEPQILERINAYFGFASVGRLKLTHGRIAPREERKPATRPLTPEEEAALEGRLAPVGAEGVKRALEALGRRVWGSIPPQGPAGGPK